MIMMSFVGGLQTIATQSYGAKNYANVGYSLQCSCLLCLVLFVFPCSLIMGLGAPLLKLTGQEPAVADDAGVYMWILLPAVLLFGWRWCLQTASMVVKVVRPFTVNAFLTCIVAITLTAVLVPRFGLLGAAAATTLYYLFNGVLDAVYSTSCSPQEESRAAARDNDSDVRVRFLPPCSAHLQAAQEQGPLAGLAPPEGAAQLQGTLTQRSGSRALRWHGSQPDDDALTTSSHPRRRWRLSPSRR